MFLATERPTEHAKEQRQQPRKVRLIWVMLLRVGLISVLLGATLILNYRSDDPFAGEAPRFLLGLIAITYLGAIVYAVWYRSGRALRLLAYVQLSLDLAFWGCLTYGTGGVVSGFTFLFHLWVIVWAVVLGGRAAFYAAFISMAMILVLGIAMFSGILAPLADQVVPEISLRELSYFVAVNIIALLIVAGLVNSLVARLERTGLGLEVERVRRADLAQLHADMIRSLTVGIATTGSAGEVLMMNPAGLGTLGLEAANVEGELLSRWLPDVDQEQATEESSRYRGRGEGVRADGRRVPVEFIVAPLTGANGFRRGSIVVFSDLTEVRRLEVALERSRRLAALGELAASLAHEIRNPLGAISGSFQILASSPSLADEDATLIQIISRELHRMERLIGDMLGYARPKQTRPGPVDIGKLAGEIVQISVKGQEWVGRNLKTSVEQGAELVAEVDSAQMRQVIWNLLRNAAQATEPGDNIETSVRREKDNIVIEIRDSGCGIPAEDRGKIFDPFYSSRERGLGIGLALCKRIVDDHGGEIAALPREGGGSVFRVTLPRVESASGMPNGGPATLS